MGVSISRYSDLGGNEYLSRFCSEENISPNDPFWNKLLSFNINPPKNAEEQLFLDSSTETLLHKFLENNTQSGNLGSLVRVFITRASELLAAPSTDNAMLAWQTFNALFVIRAVAKYLIETIPEYQLCQHFDVAVPGRTTNGIYAPSQELFNGDSLPPVDKASEASEHAVLSTENASANHQLDGAKLSEAVEISQSADTLATQSLLANEATQNGNTEVQNDTRATQKETQPSPKLNLNESKLEMLIDALVGLIIDVPVTENTYYLHLECINTLLVLMSVYMFAHVHGQGQTRHIETSLIYRTLFRGRYSMHAPMLVKTLLQNLAAMRLAPEHMFGVGAARGSLVLGLASGLWSILTLSPSSGKRQSLYDASPEPAELPERLARDHPVANQSCLLLLALTNHCCGQDNLYRRALFACEDAAEPVSTKPQKNGAGAVIDITPPRIEMSAIHRALCATAPCEHSTLLLYLMLHACKAYRRYVCTVADLESLIVPVLRCLYAAPDSNSHHIYMALIIVLILSEDDSLIKSVHQIRIKNLAWYTERSLSEISLGGLMVLVILRTVQYNILRVRDKYLHTNCLAALANMSGEFRNLHPYVAQRLVSLFEILSKRKSRLEEMAESSMDQLVDVHGVDVSKLCGEDKQETIVESICVLEEVLRMLLEILNSCLSNQLQSNLDLVYALLYKKQLFAQCAHDVQFQDIVQNIEMVVGYFSSRLQRVQEGAGGELGVTEVLATIRRGAEQWSSDRLKVVVYFSSRLQRVQEGAGGELGVTEVLATIRRGAEQWSSDRLKKFPALKFRYVEEERPEEFFTPYVWSLVGSRGAIYWASEAGARAHRDLVNC